VRLPASVLGSASNAAPGDSSSSTRARRTVTVPASRSMSSRRNAMTSPRRSPHHVASSPVPRSDCLNERGHLNDGRNRTFLSLADDRQANRAQLLRRREILLLSRDGSYFGQRPNNLLDQPLRRLRAVTLNRSMSSIGTEF